MARIYSATFARGDLALSTKRPEIRRMNQGSLQDLSKRLLVAGITIACVVVFIVLSQNFYVQIFLSALVALLAGIGMWEFMQMGKRPKPLVHLLVGASVAMIASLYIALNYQDLWRLPWIVFFLIGFLIFLYHFNKIEGALINIAVSILGICYVTLPIGLILVTLYYPETFGKEDGRMWIAYLLSVTKISDVAGYFLGRLFGRKKLTPNLSPGKTILGSAAGFFSSCWIKHCLLLHQRAFWANAV